MPNKRDISGMRFGRVVALYDTGKRSKSKKPIYYCVCDCGTEFETIAPSLINGDAKSCGCLKREKLRKHGMHMTKLYRRWADMLSRCRCKNSSNYKYYGAKGVRVTPEWEEFESFMEWSLENGYAENLSIDRINPAGDYEPSNCRWADRRTQDRNRRNSRTVCINGEEINLKTVSELSGLNYGCLSYRYQLGIRDEEILKPTQRGIKLG